MELFSQDIIGFLQAYGYWAALVVMVVSGPVGAIASGFLAGVGFFNISAIWLMSWAVDISSDIFYYELGRHGGRRIVEGLSGRFSRIAKINKQIEWLFEKHGRKTLLIIKFTQGLSTWTQILAGMARMSRKYFILVNFFAGGVKSAILVTVGVLVGSAWQVWVGRIEQIGSIIAGLVIVSILLLTLAAKFQSKFIKKIQ